MLAVAAVVGGAAAVGLAALFLRWPWLLPMAALACAPARVPVKVGGEEASLLLPLYAVVIAGVLALAWELFRGNGRARELGPLAWPLAAFIAWAGSRSSGATARVGSRGSLAAFYLPFGLLALDARTLAVAATLVEGARAPTDRDGGRVRRDRDLPVADPRRLLEPEGDHRERLRAVLPRQLALLGPLDLRALPRRRDPRRARGRALRRPARLDRSPRSRSSRLWIGLVFSFSQSSFVALVAGVLGAIALSWERRAVVALGLAVLALLAAGFVVPSVRGGDPRQHRPRDRKPLDARDGRPAHRRATTRSGASGSAGSRARTASGSASVRRTRRGRRRTTRRSPSRRSSAFQACSCSGGCRDRPWLPFRRASRSFAGRASLCFGLALLAILVHSLFYNAFFEDPMSWSLLGLSALGYAWRSSTRASRARSNGK